MQPVAAARALARWLALRHQALPLTEALPGLRMEPGFFDAALARWDGEDLVVHALLADPGSDPYEPGRRAEALRTGLETVAAGVPGRIRVAVHCLCAQPARAQRLREALMDHADGHFLSKVVVGRSVICLADGSVAYSGRQSVTPTPEELAAALSDEDALPSEEDGARWQLQREKEQRSLRRLLSPGASPVTWGLLAANVVVFGLQVWRAQHLGEALHVSADDAGYLAKLQMGANLKAAVLGQGEWWRLMAAAFLHDNLLHLGMNMGALYSLGRLCERLLGPWRLLAFYLAAAVFSSFVSVLFLPENVPSLGASGAILGLAGLLMAPRWRRDPRFPQALAARLYQWLAQPILFIFVLGLGFRALDLPLQFDNGAHLGGLLWGLALGYLFPSFLVRPLKRQG
jgi:membrane associated rhomboid family serine protease